MERFGPYWLLERLAVGGMAEVFLAQSQDEPDASPVVLKRILPELLDRADFVEMFLDEGRINGLLHHDNIVRLRDLGDVEGMRYIVLEYVDGSTLSRLLRCEGRTIAFPMACWIIAQACGGLGYAHRRTVTYSNQPLGIVHRDISPQNILLSVAGRVKLADFGVAKASMRLTKSDPGQLKGKYAYMSPEQYLEDRALDLRSDIFSVGAVLYECTTGHKVYGSNNPNDVLEAIKHRRYTPPEQKVADYPEALATIVNRALRWDPDERYQDALEMQQGLMELVPTDSDLTQELALLVRHCRSDRLPASSDPTSTSPGDDTSAPTRSGS